MPNDIFQFIRDQENDFQQSIEVMENWSWNMRDHIKNSLLMKHGQFIKASNELTQKNPKKNIVYPLLNLRYRAEDIDLKDIHVYVNEPDNDHKSFLIKKYHDEVYVKEHALDTLFDELKEEKIDLGGCLVRYGANGPVREDLDSIAFCDQTDIISGPIAFKEFYSPDELLQQADKGWGDEKNGADITLEDLIDIADSAKTQYSNKPTKTNTPGKYIEVYRIHGSMPSHWLKGTKDKNKERYTRQMHIVAFYPGQDGNKAGVTIYKKPEYENPFRLHLPGRKIRNRALAYGGVEELFDPQIWTDYSEIRKRDMLEAASKVILFTQDETYGNKNQLRDMENLQITTVRDGATIGQVPNGSPNVALFTEWLKEWDVQSMTVSGATDTLMGRTENTGTPFRSVALQTQNGMGLHEYRRGKFASFIAQIYEEKIIPDIIKGITNGITFIATLDSDELQYVEQRLVDRQVHDENFNRVMALQPIMTDQEKEAFEAKVRNSFRAKGNQHFIEILKDDFKGMSVAVNVNVAGKQKNLDAMSDKLSNFMRFIFSTYDPNTHTFAALEDSKSLKMLQKIFEISGLEPLDLGYATPNAKMPQQIPAQQMMMQQTALPANAPTQ